MKRKELKSKLTLNKKTIANLENNAMQKIKGGMSNDGPNAPKCCSDRGRSCSPSVYEKCNPTPPGGGSDNSCKGACPA